LQHLLYICIGGVTLKNVSTYQKENSKTDLEEYRYRELSGLIGKLVFAFGVGMALFHLYILSMKPINPWIFRATHLFFASVLTFCLVPYKRTSSELKRISLIDLIWISLSILTLLYIIFNLDHLTVRAGIRPTTLDVLVGTIAVLTTIEMIRRVQGWALPIISLVFFVYALFGNYLPGYLRHKGYTYERTISFIFSQDGIYGTVLDASATFIIMFLLFGAFLQASGVGSYLIDLAICVAGRARGGPAKVSVVASALMGTMSGSAVSNVVTTGNMTIPLMKALGYRPSFAAAVETVASCGGQIMPPVMSATVFVMAEVTGIPYIEIIKSALIPALLYFLCVLIIVDIEAVNLGLKGIEKEKIPGIKKLLNRLFLIVPIIILVIALMYWQVSPLRAAMYSTLSVIPISYLSLHSRMNIKKIMEALYTGALGTISIASTCALAGVIIGILSLTGLALKFANIIIALSGGNMFLTLVLGMIITIILGMGLPTIAAYLMCAVTIAPALISLGIPTLSAHLFVFYFSCLSTITPPIAIAAYAAAAIASSNPLKTAMTAVKLGIVAFIIPFMFVYGPPMLMIGTAKEVILSLLSASIGVVALAHALQNRSLNIIVRTLYGISSFLLLYPHMRTDLLGIALISILIISNIYNKSKGVKRYEA